MPGTFNEITTQVEFKKVTLCFDVIFQEMNKNEFGIIIGNTILKKTLKLFVTKLNFQNFEMKVNGKWYFFIEINCKL